MRFIFLFLAAVFVASGHADIRCGHARTEEVRSYIRAVAESVPVRYDNTDEVQILAADLICTQLRRFSGGMRSDHLLVAAAYARGFRERNPYAVAEYPDAFLWLAVVLLQIAFNYHSDSKFKTADLAKFMDVSTANAEYMYIGILKSLDYDLRLHYCRKRIPAYSSVKCECKNKNQVSMYVIGVPLAL